MRTQLAIGAKLIAIYIGEVTLAVDARITAHPRSIYPAHTEVCICAQKQHIAGLLKDTELLVRVCASEAVGEICIIARVHGGGRQHARLGGLSAIRDAAVAHRGRAQAHAAQSSSSKTTHAHQPRLIRFPSRLERIRRRQVLSDAQQRQGPISSPFSNFLTNPAHISSSSPSPERTSAVSNLGIS